MPRTMRGILNYGTDLATAAVHTILHPPYHFAVARRKLANSLRARLKINVYTQMFPVSSAHDCYVSDASPFFAKKPRASNFSLARPRRWLNYFCLKRSSCSRPSERASKSAARSSGSVCLIARRNIY